MPPVVPQLKTITIGGAVAGVGIEATSFRYGLVHESVLEMEILTGNGEVITCSPTKNPDLFRAFPNSYGTFGYAIKLKVKLIPVKKFVKIRHERFGDAETYFQAVKKACEPQCVDADSKQKADFVDGSIFSSNEMYLTTGEFADEAPSVSDYTYMNIYYKSIQEKGTEGKEDYLPVRDFIWRWDTDWFWCSKGFGAQNSFIRRLWGKKRLNSGFYWKVRKLAETNGFMRLVRRIAEGFDSREAVIQDIEVPIENAPKFAEFFHKEIGIKPVWMCPLRAYDVQAGRQPGEAAPKFCFYALDPKKLYVNFGFWDSVASEKEPGHYKRLIEAKVNELQGKKSLYSESFYTPEEFWALYDKKA